MALPFLWQMSKSVNPIVDEFIFIVRIQYSRGSCQRLFRISFREVNWASKLGVCRASYRTAQTPNICTWAKVRIENNLWSFVVERNGNSVVKTVHILFAKIYNLETWRVIADILRISRLYLITRRLRGQRSIDSLNLTDLIAFGWRTLATSHQV